MSADPLAPGEAAERMLEVLCDARVGMLAMVVGAAADVLLLVYPSEQEPGPA